MCMWSERSTTPEIPAQKIKPIILHLKPWVRWNPPSPVTHHCMVCDKQCVIRLGGMSGPSSRGAAIQRILSKSKAVSNGSHAQPHLPNQSQSSRPKDNASVVAFLNSTNNERFIQKQFKRLGRQQYERELNQKEGRWTMEIGRHRYDVNRYTDVIPYDSARVVLRSGGNDTNNNKDDYINASYVYTPKRSRRYIATQGPLENTVEHFWRMIWENISNSKPDTVSTIIMLTRVTEGGVEKCTHYWPEQVEVDYEIPYQDEQSIVV